DGELDSPGREDVRGTVSGGILDPCAAVFAFPVDLVEDFFWKDRTEPAVYRLAVQPLQRGRRGDLVARANGTRHDSFSVHRLDIATIALPVAQPRSRLLAPPVSRGGTSRWACVARETSLRLC